MMSVLRPRSIFERISQSVLLFESICIAQLENSKNILRQSLIKTFNWDALMERVNLNIKIYFAIGLPPKKFV